MSSARPPGRYGRPSWWPDDEPWPPTGDSRHVRQLFLRHSVPWWPEDEEWPPVRDWREVRRHFVRRALLFAVIALALLVAISVIVFHFVFEAHGHMGWQGRPAFGIVFFLVIGTAIFFRLFRSTAAPLSEIMDATGRLAAGDYSVRVDQRGGREQRGMTRAFNDMAERLQASEAQRRELLADIAHELRTPLSIIRGNAEGLLDGVYEADESHVGPIVDEAEVMARLLDDLATLSKAEAGQLALQREKLDPAELARDATEAFRSRAETAGVALSLDAADGLPAIDGDPIRLHEVLSNLIANALNHTPSGGTIQVQATSDARAEIVRFVVQDSGEGIAAEDLPHIFDRFSRSPGSRGSGLGLAIARSLVRAHGGDIEASSQPGHGTTISFSIPTA